MFIVVDTITQIFISAASLLPKIIEIAGNKLLQLSEILTGILKDIDLLKPNEDAKNLGDKVLQAEAEGIKPENYDYYTEYLKSVEDYQIDPAKSDKIDESKKLEKGIEVITATLLELYGTDFKDFLLIVANNPNYFNDRMKYFTEIAKTYPELFTDISQYIQGKETGAQKMDETLQLMFDVEKKVAPDANISDLMKDIEKLKD